MRNINRSKRVNSYSLIFLVIFRNYKKLLETNCIHINYKNQKGAQKIMNLGIDIGNYGTKTSTGIIFESKVSKSSILTTNPICSLEGETYILGEGVFETEYRKVKKQNYLKLLFGAITLSSEDRFNNIVLGLPISQYKADKEELIGLVLTNSLEGSINHVERKIVIEDIEVYPEAVGAVEDDFEGIVIDIGGRTTDCCLIIRSLDKRKIENPFSLSIGTLNLYSDFIKTINNKFGLDLRINDAARVLKHGLKVNNNEIDIKDCMMVFKDFVENLINNIKVEYPLSTLDVRLVGGGSVVLATPLLKRLPQAQIINNSVFANAMAFGKVGEKLWQKR